MLAYAIVEYEVERRAQAEDEEPLPAVLEKAEPQPLRPALSAPRAKAG